MKYWIKIDRFSAWVLLFGMILYFISGYGMTKGIFDPGLATKIHLDYLSIIVIVAFVIHAGTATRLALMRWQYWNFATKLVWGAFFLLFLFGFLFIDKLYQPEKAQVSEGDSVQTSGSSADNQSAVPDTSADSSAGSSATSTSEKTFTKSELAQHNGENGNPAYVAVDGKVYDLTFVFIQGKHFSHYAGQELTASFYSYHIKNQISKYPIVGVYTN
jgi:predicted heme/steroid binding protein